MKKKKYLFFFKILVSIFILYFLLKKIDFIQVISTLKQIKFGIIVFLFFTTFLKLLIEIINWKIFLQISPEYKPKIGEIIKSHFIGHSLRFLVPGGHGIIGKIYFVENKKKDTFLSLSIEKFFQIWLIVLFAAFSSIFYFKGIDLYLKISLLLLIFLIPFLLVLFHKIKFLQNYKLYIFKYQTRIPTIIMLQICYMIITVLQYFMILSPFSEISFFQTLISIPLILFANTIPITYAGLGLREVFAIKVLSNYQIQSEIAVAASLIVFFFNSVLPALVGLYFIIRKKS